MNTTYQDIIRSFVNKYGLSRGQVIAEIEKTFSSMLSQWHQQNVVAMFSDDQLMALGYHETTGVVEQKPIELTTMRGWNTIKRILDKNMRKAACLQEVARYKRKEREMRWGEIIKQNDEGGFYVELEIEKEKPVIALCAGNHIGVHERDKLKVGQRRAFHLRRVEPVMVNDTPRIKVVVDRVSKTLVENLLKSQSGNRKVNIRCLNRYVGRKSFVESSRFLPKKAILAASRELNEHIQVKVVKTAWDCIY